MRKSMLCGLWIFCLAVTMAAMPAVAGSLGSATLVTDLAVEKSALTTEDAVIFRFTLTNNGADDLYILKWMTPFAGFEADLFRVERDGELVQYVGPMLKRTAPRAKDYLRLPAGESRSVSFDLSEVYDMRRPGHYNVSYQAEGVGIVREDFQRGTTVSGVLESLWSSSVNLEMSGRDLGGSVDSLPAALENAVAGPLDTKSLTPTYRNCSNSRITQIGSSLSNAQTYSTNAYNYLVARTTTADRSASTRYKTWFGTYTSSRYTTVQSHFNSLKNALAGQTFILNCDCASDNSVYAYVYANQPYEIHLCGAFFAAPATGTDSKAGTIVHETSHFTVVAGTKDNAYGQSACKSLAISNPTKAVANADSHEYFGENTPSLP